MAGGVALQRTSTGGVLMCVIKREGSIGRLSPVLLKSAPVPVAVFWSPVLAKASSARSCVVATGCVVEERLKTGGCVVDAGRQANERLNIFRC